MTKSKFWAAEGTARARKERALRNIEKRGEGLGGGRTGPQFYHSRGPCGAPKV
jgi:hypothetical protein